VAIAIRGGSPATAFSTVAAVSVTLTGTRQPQSGDVLCIIHCNDFYALSAMTTPSVGGSTSGVNPINGTGLPADGGSNFAHAKPYVYIVGSTGDLTVSETETGAGDEEKGLAVFVLSGVDTGSPIDVAVGAFDSSSTSTTSHICPSASPSSSDAFLICHVNDGGGADSGPVTGYPSGMNSAYDVDAGGMSFSGATQQLSASGATGTKTFVMTLTQRNYTALTIAFKTAGAGGTPADAPPPNFDGPAPGLFTGPDSLPAPWAGTDSSTMQVDAQSGQAAVAAASYATAVKVAPVAGRCAAAAFSRGAGVKSAPQSGPAAAATRTSGTAAKVAPKTGATAAVAFLTGNLGARAETGRTFAAPASTATAVKVVSLAGRCATAAVARATQVKAVAPQGVTATATATRAAVVKRATPAGSASTAAFTGGSTVKRSTATGRTYAVAVALKVSTTRSLTGSVFALAASFPRANPSGRPGSGSTTRPVSGNVERPYAGVIHRP